MEVRNSVSEGVVYGLTAYICWGLVPIYFRWLGPVEPLHVLAHRIAWSAVFLGLILTLAGRWPETVRCFRTPRILLPLTASALLVAGNWLIYILCVYWEIIVQASLGYFILPLVSILLGVLIFRERLRPLQLLAIAFASVGVASLAWSAGVMPWLALALALSFSIYGIIRKQVPVDGLIGLCVETIVLLPITLGYLAFVYWQGKEIESADPMFRLSLGGVVTAIPLLCFGQAARRLPLATLGFMQYIAPSIQFVLALWLFGEERRGGWSGYLLVWTALLIFSIDSYRWYRRQETAVAEVI